MNKGLRKQDYKGPGRCSPGSILGSRQDRGAGERGANLGKNDRSWTERSEWEAGACSEAASGRIPAPGRESTCGRRGLASAPVDFVTPRALLTPTASRAHARAANPAARARPGSGAPESGAPRGQGGKAERGADLSASWPPRDRASPENLGPRRPLGLGPRALETASRSRAGRGARSAAWGAWAGRRARRGGAVTGRQGAWAGCVGGACGATARRGARRRGVERSEGGAWCAGP